MAERSEWAAIRKVVCDIEECIADEATAETTEAAIELLQAIFQQGLIDSLDRHRRYVAQMDEVSRLRSALQDLYAFVSVMIGHGPDASIPETIDTPLGVPVKIGSIMRDASAAIAKAEGRS